ncbi:MAG: hypothetical protein ACU843_09865 [Gammaproteobacteria bacterium]
MTIKQSASRTYENTLSNRYNSHSGKTHTFNMATHFDDKVAAASRQTNMDSYPVIGRMRCS